MKLCWQTMRYPSHVLGCLCVCFVHSDNFVIITGYFVSQRLVNMVFIFVVEQMLLFCCDEQLIITDHNCRNLSNWLRWH